MSPIWARRKRSRYRIAGFVLVASVILGLAALSRIPPAPHTGTDETPFEISHIWTGGAAETEAENIVSGIAFAMCARPPHDNCVIDGDTFYVRHQSIRLVDVDTPELNPSRCAYEARLGAEAKARLLELLNDGPFTLEIEGVRDEDPFGRKLRAPVRDGRSFGDILANEGLARRWTGRRQPWCE